MKEQSLYQQWLDAKQTEREAIAKRREIEDELAAIIGISETDEGSRSVTSFGYKVSVTSRMTRKVDPDLVQELAAEHGITEHLSRLFRWKPEINMRAWKDSDESITGPLMAAITTKPARPSFSISKEDEHNG